MSESPDGSGDDPGADPGLGPGRGAGRRGTRGDDGATDADDGATDADADTDTGIQTRVYTAYRCPKCEWFGIWEHLDTTPDRCWDCDTRVEKTPLTREILPFGAGSASGHGSDGSNGDDGDDGDGGGDHDHDRPSTHPGTGVSGHV